MTTTNLFQAQGRALAQPLSIQPKLAADILTATARKAYPFSPPTATRYAKIGYTAFMEAAKTQAYFTREDRDALEDVWNKYLKHIT